MMGFRDDGLGSGAWHDSQAELEVAADANGAATISRDRLTPAQHIMREEMSQGSSKPVKLSDLMEGLFGGPEPDPRLADMVQSIIQGDRVLRLGIQEWQAVQALVEQGIKQGYALAAEDLA